MAPWHHLLPIMPSTLEKTPPWLHHPLPRGTHYVSKYEIPTTN